MPLFSRAGRAPSEAPTFTDEPAERPRMSTLMRSQRKLLLLEIGADGLFQSGGQKQRIAIARALLRGPDVIVLDEPSSALDAKSEALVQRALDSTTCSMLVVAHRLATIASADRIFVLNKGVVVEEGNHEDLMRADGEYAAMVRRQEIGTDAPDAAAAPHS